MSDENTKAIETPDSAASALSAGLEGPECGARALEILEALKALGPMNDTLADGGRY